MLGNWYGPVGMWFLWF